MEKRRNCLRSNFSSFPQYFQYISNLGVRLHIHYVKDGCSINCFPQFRKSDNRRTDISKCFIESLGFRDNESLLYVLYILTLIPTFSDILSADRTLATEIEFDLRKFEEQQAELARQRSAPPSVQVQLRDLGYHR